MDSYTLNFFRVLELFTLFLILLTINPVKDQSCYFINPYHWDEDWFQIGKSIFKTQDSTINNHSQESLTASSNGVFNNSKQQILYNVSLKSTYSKCSKQSRFKQAQLFTLWEEFGKPITAAAVTTAKYLMHLSVFICFCLNEWTFNCSYLKVCAIVYAVSLLSSVISRNRFLH